MADNKKEQKGKSLFLNGLSTKQVVPAKAFEDGKLTDKDDPNFNMVTIFDKDSNGYRFRLSSKQCIPQENGRINVRLYEAEDEAGNVKAMSNVWKFSLETGEGERRSDILPSELQSLHKENMAAYAAAKAAEAEVAEAPVQEEKKDLGKMLWLNGIHTYAPGNETETKYKISYFDKEGRKSSLYLAKDHVVVDKDSARIFENGEYVVRHQVEAGSKDYETTVGVKGSEIYEAFVATKEAQKKYAQAMTDTEAEAAAEAPEPVEEELEA